MLYMPPEEEIAPKKVKLGPQQRLKTLVLDMDETLVHSNFYALTEEELAAND